MSEILISGHICVEKLTCLLVRSDKGEYKHLYSIIFCFVLSFLCTNCYVMLVALFSTAGFQTKLLFGTLALVDIAKRLKRGGFKNLQR